MGSTFAFREASGDVVLKSGPNGQAMALRFANQFGGSPLEIWDEPNPGPVTYSFAGSGVSLVFEVGQDPTQASANGILRNPIARLNHLGSAKYNYYLRELLLDPLGVYTIQGFFPDFWLSHEAIDDSIMPTSADHGWRTYYNNPEHLPYWLVPSAVVAFRGASSQQTGRFYVGNQIVWAGLPWNERLRCYTEGRIAAKVKVAMVGASEDAAGGFVFKQNVNDPDVPGFKFSVTKTGVWSLVSLGAFPQIAYGKISKAQIKNLSTIGVMLEVRTHNGDLSYVELYIDDVMVWSGKLPGTTKQLSGPHFCLDARSSSGLIQFNDRQVFDVSTQVTLTWRALEGRAFESDATIDRAPGAEGTVSTFYRAGIGVFLNPLIFPNSARIAKTIDCTGNEKEEEGVFKLKDYASFYIGNGNSGIKATPIFYALDDVSTIPTGEAHVLTQKHAINDEFYMGFNPFAYGQSKLGKKIQMVTKWETRP